MIHIIAGEKGKGKTKVLIEKANNDLETVKGSIVYLDKSNKHMHELSNKIRLINVNDYLVKNEDEFLGFILGIISQDHDLEYVFFDSFLRIAGIEDLPSDEQAEHFKHIIEKFEEISKKFNVKFVISISMKKDDFPENAKEYIKVSL